MSVRLSLTGMAKNVTSEMLYEENISTCGMDKTFEKLQDKNWRRFHAYLNFAIYNGMDGSAVEGYLSYFIFRVFTLKESIFELFNALLPCRTWKSCSLSVVHIQLTLSTCHKLTLDNMRDTLRKLFSENS